MKLKVLLLIGVGVSDFETSARHYTSSKRGNTQVQQMRAVEELLQELIRHSDAWPFLKPVDKKLVPSSWLSLLFLVCWSDLTRKFVWVNAKLSLDRCWFRLRSGSGRRGELYLTLHRHHQSDSCIKMGNDKSCFNVSLIAKAGNQNWCCLLPSPYCLATLAQPDQDGPCIQAFLLVQGREEGGRSTARFQLYVVNFLCNSSKGRAGARKGKEGEKQIVPIFCSRPLAEAAFSPLKEVTFQGCLYFTPWWNNFVAAAFFHPTPK